MPEMRTAEGRERLSAPRAVTYEPWDSRPAIALARRRRGRFGPVPVEARNGLPWKPYVYRGVGYDIYSGEGDDDA